MEKGRWRAWASAAALLAALAGCAGSGGRGGMGGIGGIGGTGTGAVARADTGAEAYPRLRIAYVAFPQAGVERPLPITGQLRVPRVASGRVPAVVIVHGTNGLDSRGELHAEALNRAGIATLELDL